MNRKQRRLDERLKAKKVEIKGDYIAKFKTEQHNNFLSGLESVIKRVNKIEVNER